MLVQTKNFDVNSAQIVLHIIREHAITVHVIKYTILSGSTVMKLLDERTLLLGSSIFKPKSGCHLLNMSLEQEPI